MRSLLPFLLCGCYLSHTLEESSDAAVPDAPMDTPAADVFVEPPCAVSIGWCTPHRETYVFETDRSVGFGDITWTGSRIAVAFDHIIPDSPSASTIAMLTAGLGLVSRRDVGHIDWPDIAWHRDANVGIAVGAELIIDIDAEGRPIGERSVMPLGFGAHRATVAPVRSGFLVFVAPASGGTLRGFYGAALDTSGRGPVRWETFSDSIHVTNRVVPGLNDEGFATHIVTGRFDPQSLVLMGVEDDRPGGILFQERIGSSAGEAEAIVPTEDALYLYGQNSAAALLTEIRDGAAGRTHRIDGELLGAPVLPFATGFDGDAIALGEGIVIVAHGRDDELAVVRYIPATGEAFLRTSPAGGFRLLPRVVPTNRGYAVGYACGRTDYCVQSVDCCVLE